jgi:hypothetical protein
MPFRTMNAITMNLKNIKKVIQSVYKKFRSLVLNQSLFHFF